MDGRVRDTMNALAPPRTIRSAERTDGMPRFLIEREIPGIGTQERKAYQEASQKSNEVLNAMQAEKKKIQWEHSYVTKDATLCVYLAESEDLILEHSRRSGFPANRITLVRRLIDPVTAER